MTITLDQARTIVDAALRHGTEQGFQPLTVAVLDPGGALVALGRQDGSGFLRPELAQAKASGVLALGMTNRAIAARAVGVPVAAGEVFVLTTSGGGGLGDPFTRDPELVAADVASHTVSAEGAVRDYGVVLTASGDVDPEATAARRAVAR